MLEDDVFVDKLPSFERRADLLAGMVWAFPDLVDDSVNKRKLKPCLSNACVTYSAFEPTGISHP